MSPRKRRTPPFCRVCHGPHERVVHRVAKRPKSKPGTREGRSGLFTPVDRKTGKRLRWLHDDIEVAAGQIHKAPFKASIFYRGRTYRVTPKDCGLGCKCDAYVEAVRRKSRAVRSNPDGFWTKGPRVNPAGAHDLVDIVSARTGEVLESRLFRYVAEQNAWLFRHDGNKVRIQKHRPAKGARVKRRTNPSHGLTPHYEPEVFPRSEFYDDVDIPKGFIAQHYGNDVAPKWIHPGKRLVLWIDAKSKRDRELEGRRYVLGVTDQDFEADLEPILETDSMREVLWTIANHRPGV